MVRLRGGQAPEEFFIQVRNFDDTVIAEFDPRNRDGNVAWTTGFSTDLNLDDYDWQPEKGRPDVFKFSLSDPAQAFQNEVQEGYKVRAAFGNIMKDCVLAFDMETLNAAEEMLDLSLNGNDGVLTGTTDIVGYWGRARDFNGTSDFIDVTDDPTLDFTSGITFCIVTTPDIDTATGNRTFVNKSQSIVIRQVDDVLHFYIYDGVDSEPHVSAPNTFTAGETVRIIVTADGTDHKIFVNGKEVATLARTFLPPNNSNVLSIGAREGVQNFDGKLDKVAALIRPFSAGEVREHDDRRAAVPRYYFDGRIDNRKHDEGETQVVASLKLKELTDIDIYDLIFEGMEAGDTMKPSFVFRQESEFEDANAVHSGVHTVLRDIDLNDIAAGEVVYEPFRVEVVDQSEWFATGTSDFLALYSETGSIRASYAVRFTATSKQINKVGLLFDSQGVTEQFEIFVADKDRNFISILSITADATSGFDWRFYDFSGASPIAELSVGETYYIGIFAGFLIDKWTAATPFKWAVNSEATRQGKKDINVSWDDEQLPGPCIIIEMEGNYKPLSEGEYVHIDSTDNSVQVLDFTDSETLGTALGPGSMADVKQQPGLVATHGPGGPLRVTYFYSVGDKKISDVINRILAKTDLSAVFNQSGGLTSSATTEPLGLYVPQGGSAWEHISQLAALVGDRPKFVPPNTLSFQRWPEPTHIRNSSFELAGNGTDPLLGWGVEATGASEWTLDTTIQYSGNSSAKLDYQASGDLPRLFQDVESFDPVASGVDGNNFEVALRVNSLIVPIVIRVYDYGSFDNDNSVLFIPAATMPINTWTLFRFKVDRPSFRLAITPPGSGSLNYQFWVDDVFPHYENQRSFFLADAGAKDSDYTSGFMPGMRVGESQIGVHIYDDVEGPPNIQRETDKRSINYAVQFGRQTSAFGGPPVVAIARNKARADQIGTRLKVSRQESLRNTETAYLRAKQRLRFESRFRSTVTLIGQYPHLFGNIIRLFFPDHGLYEATPMEVTTLILGPSTTEVRFTRSFVEEFQDVEKLKEREDMLSGAFNAPDFDTLLYFTAIDLPTSVDPTAVVQARLKNQAGGISDYSPLIVRDTRDGGDAFVWEWRVGRRDGTTFDTTTTDVWDRIDIADATPTVLATITLPEEFAKLPNQWIVIWLFAGAA